MNVWATQQTAETISNKVDLMFALANAPGAQERRDVYTKTYYHERRLKAIKRYLRERAERNSK